MRLKTTDGKLIKNPSVFEIQTLKDMCIGFDCTMEQLIDAMMNNFVSESISIQVDYLKTFDR